MDSYRTHESAGALDDLRGAALPPHQPGDPFLEDVLAGRATLAAATYPTAVPRLSLVPASPELAVQARLLAAELAGETVLALHFRRQPPAAFDYVILDAPPELGMLSINALVAAAELVIPVTPGPLATQVLDQLLDTIDRVRERLNPALRIAGILPVRVRPHTLLARQALADLAARFPDLLLPIQIRDTVRAAEAPARQLPLLDDQPDSSAAQDYRTLAALIIEQEAREACRCLLRLPMAMSSICPDRATSMTGYLFFLATF